MTGVSDRRGRMVWGGAAALTAAVWVFAAAPVQAESWPMKHRDAGHTGRADYVVPADRMNDSFFDVFAWQTPTPNSPGEGNLSSTSMVFFDGVGPSGEGVVVGGYHWPKGVQGLDRHTGKRLWNGNPSGGESIGTQAPAFSLDGFTVYVVNDSTGDDEWPGGHPLMAFDTTTGPSIWRHNGADLYPNHFEMDSPTVFPDGRIFLHGWVDRPYGAYDDGTSIMGVWEAWTSAECGHSDPSFQDYDGDSVVVIGSRWGNVIAYDGYSGEERWNAWVGPTVDATVTVDPDTGNIYVPAGDASIYVVGLDRDGYPLWYNEAMQVYAYQDGVNNPQRAQSAGCLSHDGATFYFQTNSEQGDGRLYAINTVNGSVKWTYLTGSTGWEMIGSSPIVTPNGVVIVGSNEGRTWYAIRDDGTEGTLLDTLVVDAAGNARATATLSQDGFLYLPLRTTWVAGNGDGQAPDFSVQNLFCAVNLSSGAVGRIWPPGSQRAIARNHRVELFWAPVEDPGGQLDHYAIYRDTAPFTSVEGLMPLATTTGSQFDDDTAINGTRYYYAVTCVTTSGDEVKDIRSIGPRTPRDETDLQVMSVSRSPQYPRYAPEYFYQLITEPSGFGPYWFSASTGLGQGQTAGTQRWPNVGDTVTYTATIRNRGTTVWSGPFTGVWRVDGDVVKTEYDAAALDPDQTATYELTRTWEGLGTAHDITFEITATDDRSDNNTVTVNTKAVPFLTYVDRSYIEDFRERTSLNWPAGETDDVIDWLQRHMVRFNAMFAAAGCDKRVHYDILAVTDDGQADPVTDRIPYAIFPFRYYAADGDARLSGWYNATDDIDYGLLHEMGHQLGLIDIYQLDLPGSANQVSGLGYTAVDDLMRNCAPVLSPASALPMSHWLDVVHGYYGQYLYALPSEIRLRVLGFDGQPLVGATVKMYQMCERPDVGKVISTQIKAQGVTNANGEFVLPNVPIDPAIVPPTFAGDTLQANPFGYVAVVGTNGLLHFRVEYNGGVDYAWLDITEANVAYLQGATTLATFDRSLSLGGPTQMVPPNDMTENNASDWTAWGDGSSAQNTYVADDPTRVRVGSASVKFVTDGGFDTYVRYPRSFTANWDLSDATHLKISFYAMNPNFSFQNGSPWIRLRDADGNYFEYQMYENGYAVELLNQAQGQWLDCSIPLDASSTEENGWRRTVHGSPDLSHIQYVEIHADTWGYGFALWLDGVGFDPPLALTGDINADGYVNVGDLQALVAAWGSGANPRSANWKAAADINCDGYVNVGDLQQLVAHWGEHR